MPNTAPTKSSLMAAKRSRELAETGWDLMDKKRNILIREIMTRMDKARELQDEIDSTFQEAYDALAVAEIISPECGQAADLVPEDDSVRLRWRSVMGVEVPSLAADSGIPEELPYTLAGTSSALDEAYRKFSSLKGMLAELAETEIAVYSLAFSINKSKKRANALENVVIPGLDADIQRIEQVLAEKEREEFVRQKLIKARNQKKEQEHI